MLKDLFEYIQQQAQKQSIITVGGVDYSVEPKGVDVRMMRPPLADPLVISTLSGLARYLNNEVEIMPDSHIVHISGIGRVAVLSRLGEKYRTRENIITAVADDTIPEVRDPVQLDELIVYLMTKFEATQPNLALQRFLGSVQTEEVVRADDDGTAQKVTVRKGVASVSEEKVPNPITLSPIIGFPELLNPEISYILRLSGKGGDIRATLKTIYDPKVYADQIEGIRMYLEENLDDQAEWEVIG